MGGYSGGNAEQVEYRETIVRWFQYGLTCPMFRQHGDRDHTAIWFYGSKDEKLLGDLIKLRHSLKPYISAELDKLNATGRPFNRLLTWDFPSDPKVWELAEAGIGDPEPATNGTVAKPADGTWVTLAPCEPGFWRQQWQLGPDRSLQLAAAAAKGACLDNGGAVHGPPPTGPYPVHMWGCAGRWGAAQTWTFNGTAILDPRKALCLTTGDGKHPAMAKCSSTAADQQWITPGTATGPISSGHSCLTVSAPADQGAGVADQYMMGDSYMAAPVLNLGQRERRVYFPAGASWVHHYTGKVYLGGTTAVVPAPLDTFPLFKRQ